MACIAVVPLNGHGVGFADDVVGGWYYCAVNVQPIRVIRGIHGREWVIQVSAGFSITITDSPGDGAPRVTIQRLPDSEFSFFD